MIHKISYRVGQFWRTLIQRPSPTELERTENVLGPQLMDLFQRMHPAEQAHSLRILDRLTEEGETRLEVSIAALLHDVGKSRYPLRPWERALVVLAQALFPERVKQWGRGEPTGWSRAFVVAEQHPEWGAQMAEEAGAPPLAVVLIRRHQQEIPLQPATEEDRLVHRLQVHDKEN